MVEHKSIQEMTRREYCSYVQRHYSNDPQWVRTRLISNGTRSMKKRKVRGQHSDKDSRD